VLLPGIFRGKLTYCRPVQRFAAMGHQGQEAVPEQAGDGHRHLQGFGRGQGKANILLPQRCGEACRLEFAAGDQPAIGFINRRRKQGRGQQTDIAERE
jgi:hypothetical protein